MATAASTEVRPLPSPRQHGEMGSGRLSPWQRRGEKAGRRLPWRQREESVSAVPFSLATHIPCHSNREQEAAGRGGVWAAGPRRRERDYRRLGKLS